MTEERGNMGRGRESDEDKAARRAERRGRGPISDAERETINAARATRDLPPLGADETATDDDLDALDEAEAEA